MYCSEPGPPTNQTKNKASDDPNFAIRNSELWELDERGLYSYCYSYSLPSSWHPCTPSPGSTPARGGNSARRRWVDDDVAVRAWAYQASTLGSCLLVGSAPHEDGAAGGAVCTPRARASAIGVLTAKRVCSNLSMRCRRCASGDARSGAPNK